MKKKLATATVGIIAVLCIICFAVMSNRSNKVTPEEVLSMEIERTEPKHKVADGEYYAHKTGGTFEKPQAFAKEEKSSETENLWVDYEPEEFSEKLSEEEQQLIDEVVSKIPIRQSVVGLTKEEFVRKMERLDDVCRSSFFQENAELLFEIAQEEGYSEYFFPAIAWQETVGEKFAKGDFNYWNALARNGEEENVQKAIVYKDGEKTERVFHWRNFESEEECIREFYATVEEHKIYDSATTLTQFTSIWIPNTVEHPHQSERYAIILYENMLQISNL